MLSKIKKFFNRKGSDQSEEIKNLLAENMALTYKLTEAAFEIDSWKKQSEEWQEKYVDAQTRVDRYQTYATSKTRDAAEFNFMQVAGLSPILWVDSPDPAVVNAATFASLRQRMSSLAPGIEMIILTYGGVKLYELTDAQLEQLGLSRIKNHRGGSIGRLDTAPQKVT